ncbi:1175_t:CDS:2 [Funneliformis caledonium]|uniref:1175_t:CDS:1 n=1 Tax=Funneliformis caledonium TaxID=1117310 RepID=A0A9N9AKE8_9GLOM|nr:1175_t:CDS:2 [Funneliformis caledonium]
MRSKYFIFIAFSASSIFLRAIDCFHLREKVVIQLEIVDSFGISSKLISPSCLRRNNSSRISLADIFCLELAVPI